MPGGNVVLPEAVWLELRRDHYELKRQVSTLSNRLAAHGMRRHQAVYMPAVATPRVEWVGMGTKDSAVDGEFSASDNATGYFTQRIGLADIGITHDPSVSSPQTDGNFTITKTGLFLFVVEIQMSPLTSGGDWAGRTWGRARAALWYKRGTDPFAVMDPQIETSVNHDNPADADNNQVLCSVTFGSVNLEAADLVTLRLTGFSSSGTGCSWDVVGNKCKMTAYYLGTTSALTAIP
jgi:hypothetical protein